MTLERLRRIAARGLVDLHATLDDSHVERWERHNLTFEAFPVPELLLFGLTQLKGFEPFGPGEKMRWGVTAVFRETPFSIALEKFGLHLYIPGDTSDEVRAGIIRCLRTVAGLAETHLRNVAKAQLHAGNVTIENRFVSFDAAYKFFRGKAREAYASNPPEPVVRTDRAGLVRSTVYEPFRPQIEGGYFAAAMLDAYFSRLEHLLVIVLPFCDFDPDEGRLLSFVEATWDAKYRAVFDVARDREAKRAYDRLKALKERLRNPISHGGFKKKGASFYFHVDGIGALPALLGQRGRDRGLRVTFVPEPEYEELCKRLDECERYFDASPVRQGVRYAQSGLDVAFSPDFRAACRAASGSDADLDEFVEYNSRLYDMHANMDY